MVQKRLFRSMALTLVFLITFSFSVSTDMLGGKSLQFGKEVNADLIPSPSGKVLKFDATPITGKAFYWKFANAAYTFQAGDCIEYDVFLTGNTCAGLGGIEIYTAGGGNFRDCIPTPYLSPYPYSDQNGISARPNSDLRGNAEGRWYHRTIPVPVQRIGSTSSDFCIGIETDCVLGTTYTAYYDNIVVTNGGYVVKTIYRDGAPSANVKKSPDTNLNYTCSVNPISIIPPATPSPTPTSTATAIPTPTPIQTPIPTGMAYIGEYVSIYLGDIGTGLWNLTYGSVNSTPLNYLYSNLKILLRKDANDPGVVLSGSDVFNKDPQNNYTYKANNAVIGHFSTTVTGNSYTLLTIYGVGYYNKDFIHGDGSCGLT